MRAGEWLWWSFEDDHTVQVTRPDGGTDVLSAPEIVIATGTRPRPVPAQFAYLPVWTSDSLFPLRGPVPRSILKIGGGYIACELASFFSGIEVDTRMAVRGQALLDREDKEIAEVFRKEFTAEVQVDFGTTLEALTHDGSLFAATLKGPQGNECREFDAVLFAIGRIPNADEIGLEQTSIQRDARGFIETDDFLRTSSEGVYAAGDVAGKWIFQHAASYDMHFLRCRLLKGEAEPLDYGHVPHAVFAHPEVAGVGMTEAELVAQDIPFVRVFDDWQVSARAMSWRIDYPRIKLLVDPRDYRILGCYLVGPEASTLLHEVLPLMKADNDVRHIPETIHIHPALGEVILAPAVKAIALVLAWRAERELVS